MSRCQTRLLNSEAEAFLRFFVAHLAAKSIALSSVGIDPNIVARNPNLVADLDRYAEQVSTFDFDCAKRVGSPFDWRMPAFFLESVASYWTAKGEQFHVNADNSFLVAEVAPDSAATINSLCRARKMRSRAVVEFDAGRSVEQSGTNPLPSTAAGNKLDMETQESADQEFQLDERTGLDRLDQDLRAFPSAEIASACNGR